MMKKIYLLIVISLQLISQNIIGQSVGDTILVPVLDYTISSRNVVANFPNNSNLSFEKVIMRYAMRCKNAHGISHNYFFKR